MTTYNGVRSNVDSASSASIACSASISVAVGDGILVGVKYEGGTTTCNITDGLGNTFVQVDKLNHTNGEPELVTFRCVVTNAGTSTPTANLGAARVWRAIAAIFATPTATKEFAADAHIIAEGTSAAYSSGSFSPTAAGIAAGFTATYQIAGVTPGSGWTEANDADTLYAEYRLLGGAGAITADSTPGASDRWVAAGLNLLEQAAGASPTITDADTDEVLEMGQTAIALTGTNLGANTSARTLALIQNSITVTQTQTAGDATTGTFDLVTESAGVGVKFGSATLRVTIVAGGAQGNINVTVNPATGQVYTNLGTIFASATDRITAAGDIATGDQLHMRGVGGGAIPTGLTVNSDGTFQFSVGNNPAAFDVRVWNSIDGTWGAWATQSVAGTSIAVKASHYRNMGMN